MNPFPALCALLAAYCTLPLAASDKKAPAKKQEAPGYLLYVNTVGDRGWSFFVLDGEDIQPSGIETGFRSSWVSYPAGKRKLQFEHQPLGLVDMEADLQPGALHAFIAYSDQVLQPERPGRPPRPVLAVKELRCDLILPPEKQHGHHMAILNLTPSPVLRVRVGTEDQEAPRLQATLVVGARLLGAMEISVLPSPGLPTDHTEPPGEPTPQVTSVVPSDTEETPLLTQRLNFEDAGTRFVIFYLGKQNSVQSVVFDNIGMQPGSSSSTEKDP